MARKKIDEKKTPPTGGRAASLANLTARGRPKGVPNKVTTEAKAACNDIVDDPIYRAALLKRMRAGTAGQMEPIIWYYAKGKPKERVEFGADKTLAQLVAEAALRRGPDKG